MEFPVSDAELWDVLSDTALLGVWFDGEVALDLRSGGALIVTGADGETRAAVIDEVAAPRRLAFTWQGDGAVPASTVEIELEPGEGGCGLRIRETLIEVPEPVPFPIGFQPPSSAHAV